MKSTFPPSLSLSLSRASHAMAFAWEKQQSTVPRSLLHSCRIPTGHVSTLCNMYLLSLSFYSLLFFLFLSSWLGRAYGVRNHHVSFLLGSAGAGLPPLVHLPELPRTATCQLFIYDVSITHPILKISFRRSKVRDLGFIRTTRLTILINHLLLAMWCTRSSGC